MSRQPIRVAVCADFREERWPSMDRVAERLVQHLRRDHTGAVDVAIVRPRFCRRASGLWGDGRSGATLTVDRLLNRLWDYPRHVSAISGDFDLFHIVDHSYAHLVHRLPSDRTVVTCHDLDAFRSILQPMEQARTALFRAMARHALAGVQRAARVTCDTAAVRDELVSQALIAPDRVVVAPIGTGAEYSDRADPDADREAARLIRTPPGAVELLHVGSTIPRKRIDLLLQIYAELLSHVPSLHLVRVGGEFTGDQRRLARALGVDRRLSVLEFLDERVLAAVYRRAALLLLPSDREGFGLPLVEAMASGTPAVVSDLAPLREVGGSAAEYCPPGCVAAWSARILDLLCERSQTPARWNARRQAGLIRARRFTWPHFAGRLAQLYGEVVAEADSGARAETRRRVEAWT
jgi:glycosyltransferase involved in cell wall biosynthesis